MREVRTLLERFANNVTLDTTIESVNVLIDDSRRDPELRHWFKDVDTYIRKVWIFVGSLLVVNSFSLTLQILLEPGYVLETTCNDQGRELRESGRRFYDDKYKSHFDNLFNNVSSWFSAMGEDPVRLSQIQWGYNSLYYADE
jgi:hypothetical protein